MANEIIKRADDFFVNDKFTEAKDLFLQVINDHGKDKNPIVNMNLAICYSELKEYPTACQYFEKASELLGQKNQDLLQ